MFTRDGQNLFFFYFITIISVSIEFFSCFAVFDFGLNYYILIVLINLLSYSHSITIQFWLFTNALNAIPHSSFLEWIPVTNNKSITDSKRACVMVLWNREVLSTISSCKSIQGYILSIVVSIGAPPCFVFFVVMHPLQPKGGP